MMLSLLKLRQAAMLSFLCVTTLNLFGQPWGDEMQLRSPIQRLGDNLGSACAVRGAVGVVGSSGHDLIVPGVNTFNAAGTAYIVLRDSNNDWSIHQKLDPTDPNDFDRFGNSAAVGNQVVMVGAPFDDENALGNFPETNAGSVFIYTPDTNGNWNLLQKIVPSDRSSSDNFGTALAVDGDVAVISAIQDANGLPGQPTLGLAGSAYVFTQNQNGSWSQTVKLVPSDREVVDQFGKSVAVSGNTIMVGAWQEDQDENNANFITDAGSVYVFEKDSAGNWNQVQKLTASDRSFNDRFGNAVALDGNYAVIAAIAQDLNAAGGQPVTDAGAAYIFERDTVSGLWSEVQKLTPTARNPDEFFGNSVAMDGPRALIGAVQKTVNLGPLTFTEVGSAHLFERTDNGTWQQVHLFSASDRASEDNYGQSVDLSGDHVFIGANREDGSQGPFSQTAATGALYTYRFCPTSDTIAVHACGPYTAPSGNVYATAGSYLDTTVNTAGCDSVNLIHLTIGVPTQDTLTIGSCGPYLAPSGTVTWNFSGTYQDVIPNASGCDSVMIIQLTIDPVDVSVTRQNAALIANEFNAAYQWLDCNSGFAAVDGATERIFTPENNGSFAVRVDNGSCVDTSACFPLTNVSTQDLMAQEGLRLFPNPTDGQLTVVFGNGSLQRVRIVALDGRVLHDYRPATPAGSATLSVPGPGGIYTVEVWKQGEAQPFRKRLVKLAP